MSFPFLLILGVLLVTWSFLSVLGNERQRRMQGAPPGPTNASPAPASPPPEAPVGG